MGCISSKQKDPPQAQPQAGPVENASPPNLHPAHDPPGSRLHVHQNPAPNSKAGSTSTLPSWAVDDAELEGYDPEWDQAMDVRNNFGSNSGTNPVPALGQPLAVSHNGTVQTLQMRGGRIAPPKASNPSWFNDDDEDDEVFSLGGPPASSSRGGGKGGRVDASDEFGPSPRGLPCGQRNPPRGSPHQPDWAMTGTNRSEVADSIDSQDVAFALAPSPEPSHEFGQQQSYAGGYGDASTPVRGGRGAGPSYVSTDSYSPPSQDFHSKGSDHYGHDQNGCDHFNHDGRRPGAYDSAGMAHLQSGDRGYGNENGYGDDPYNSRQRFHDQPGGGAAGELNWGVEEEEELEQEGPKDPWDNLQRQYTLQQTPPRTPPLDRPRTAVLDEEVEDGYCSGPVPMQQPAPKWDGIQPISNVALDEFEPMLEVDDTEIDYDFDELAAPTVVHYNEDGQPIIPKKGQGGHPMYSDDDEGGYGDEDDTFDTPQSLQLQRSLQEPPSDINREVFGLAEDEVPGLGASRARRAGSPPAGPPGVGRRQGGQQPCTETGGYDIPHADIPETPPEMAHASETFQIDHFDGPVESHYGFSPKRTASPPRFGRRGAR